MLLGREDTLRREVEAAGVAVGGERKEQVSFLPKRLPEVDVKQVE
jgi:hypothetical protein